MKAIYTIQAFYVALGSAKLVAVVTSMTSSYQVQN